MLTKTTRTGIQTLLYLALDKEGEPVSPRTIATALGCSPTYLAKVTAQLARAGILTTHRGVKGGVTLRRDPNEIRLLEIVEALQGPVLEDYCGAKLAKPLLCQFHHAMLFLHEAILDALTRWSLADIAKPPAKGGRDNPACLLGPVLCAMDSANKPSAPQRRSNR